MGTNEQRAHVRVHALRPPCGRSTVLFAWLSTISRASGTGMRRASAAEPRAWIVGSSAETFKTVNCQLGWAANMVSCIRTSRSSMVRGRVRDAPLPRGRGGGPSVGPPCSSTLIDTWRNLPQSTMSMCDDSVRSRRPIIWGSTWWIEMCSAISSTSFSFPAQMVPMFEEVIDGCFVFADAVALVFGEEGSSIGKNVHDASLSASLSLAM